MFVLWSFIRPRGYIIISSSSRLIVSPTTLGVDSCQVYYNINDVLFYVLSVNKSYEPNMITCTAWYTDQISSGDIYLGILLVFEKTLFLIDIIIIIIYIIIARRKVLLYIMWWFGIYLLLFDSLAIKIIDIAFFNTCFILFDGNIKIHK